MRTRATWQGEYELVLQPRLAGHGPTLFAGLSKHVGSGAVGGNGRAQGLRQEGTQTVGEHRSEAHSASSVQSAPSGKRGVQVVVGGAILVPVVVQSMAGSAQGMPSQDSPCWAGPAHAVWG